MLKKFYIEEYLNKKEELDNYELISEAYQGDISKYTLSQLFSKDNIKYLYQFDPEDHIKAEIERMEKLYEAMEKRQEFMTKHYEDNFAIEKDKLEKLFASKKATKIYFSKDFERSIINHCATRKAWEKTLEEQGNSWWKDTSSIGGAQFLGNVDVKVGHKGSRIYSVKLFLKEMIDRIEGEAGKEGSDLSFPRIDSFNWNAQKNKFVEEKRFNGMFIPKEMTMKKNYERWLSASSNGLLSNIPLKHGVHTKIEEIGDSAIKIPGIEAGKKLIEFKQDPKLKNRELLRIEKVIMEKEARAIFEDGDLSSRIVSSYGNPSKAKGKKEPSRNTSEFPTLYPKNPEYYDNLKTFAQRLINAHSEGTFDFFDISKYDSKKPEDLIKSILELSSEEKQILPGFIYEIVKQSSEQIEDSSLEEMDKKTKKTFSLFDQVLKAVSENGVIEIFDNQSYKNSYMYLMSLRQLIKWIKEGNYKIKNPITGKEEAAVISGNEIIFPNLYKPTFKHNIAYKSQGKEVKLTGVEMPVLLPGSVLMEKGLGEDESMPDEHGIVKPLTGEEIYNPRKKRFEQRYYDMKKYFDEKKAKGVLKPFDLIGIQGSEDKIVGGLNPNRNIESYKFLCPDENDNTFWNRINSLVMHNGGLSVLHFTPSATQDTPPNIKLSPVDVSSGKDFSIEEKPEDRNNFVVVTDIAEAILRRLDYEEYRDGHAVKYEKTVLLHNFPDLYHTIFAKVFANLGDESMLETNLLKIYINEKISNYIDKNLGQGARRTKSGKVASEIGKEEEDPSKVKPKLPEGLEKLVGREVATKNIQMFLNALHRNFLGLCRTSLKACDLCTDPFDPKCTIVIDEHIVRKNLKESLELASKVDSIDKIKVKKPRSLVSKPETPFAPTEPSVAPSTQPKTLSAPPAAPPVTPSSAPPAAPPVTPPSAPPAAPPAAPPVAPPSAPPSASPSAPPAIAPEPASEQIKNPDPNVRDFVVKAKIGILNNITPLILKKFANIKLDEQQRIQNEESKVFNEYMRKQRELLDSNISDEEKQKVQDNIEKEKEKKYQDLAKEYEELTKSLEENKKQIVVDLTNYFNYMEKTQSVRLKLVEALELYGIDISEHVSQSELKKHGLI